MNISWAYATESPNPLICKVVLKEFVTNGAVFIA
jgi:hypothetical protein